MVRNDIQILLWRNNPLLNNGVLKHVSRQRTRLEESKRCLELTQDTETADSWNTVMETLESVLLQL
jgi:hypothetical protein